MHPARQRLPWIVDRVSTGVLQLFPVARHVRVRLAPQALEAIAHDERPIAKTVLAFTLAELPFEEAGCFVKGCLRNRANRFLGHRFQVDVERQREGNESTYSAGISAIVSDQWASVRENREAVPRPAEGDVVSLYSQLRVA